MPAEEFERVLVSQFVDMSRRGGAGRSASAMGGESFTKRNSVDKAKETLDAFARHFYSLLFAKMVTQANASIGYKQGVTLFIGVLDIFGFECFKENHFEQLCINYANERLQKHFNDYVFREEAKMYEAEGIEWKDLDFPDNRLSCGLVEDKGTGRCLFLLLRAWTARASRLQCDFKKFQSSKMPSHIDIQVSSLTSPTSAQ